MIIYEYKRHISFTLQPTATSFADKASASSFFKSLDIITGTFSTKSFAFLK